MLTYLSFIYCRFLSIQISCAFVFIFALRFGDLNS